jgi:hypothetical protein
MFKQLLLLVLLFVANKLYCQNNVASYYRYINAAELSVCSGDYLCAKTNYKLAFKCKYPNGKDLYNSFLCSYFTYDTTRAIKQANLLASHGLAKDFFIDTFFAPKFYSLVYKNYDSSYEMGMLNHDAKLIQKIDSLQILDQHLRKIEIKLNDAIEGDKQIVKKFINLLDDAEWPSFEQTGFWPKLSSPLTENFPFFLVMLHNRFDTLYPYDKYAQIAITQGRLRPGLFAGIVLCRRLVKCKNYDSPKLGTNIWNLSQFSNIDIELINEQRERLFMETLADYEIKYKYQSIYNKDWGMDPLKSSFIFVTSWLIPSIDVLRNGLYD